MYFSDMFYARFFINVQNTIKEKNSVYTVYELILKTVDKNISNKYLILFVFIYSWDQLNVF